MSLLALLVGTLLIYGAVSFAVLQRRRIIGVLRALGATRARGAAHRARRSGACSASSAPPAACCSGVADRPRAGRPRLADHQRSVLRGGGAARSRCPAASCCWRCGAGLGTALVAALLPALEVASSAPQLGLERAVLERRARRAGAPAGGSLSVLLTLAAARRPSRSRSAACWPGSRRSSCCCWASRRLTPAALRCAAAAGGARCRRGQPAGAPGAARDVAASLSRTGVAVAALGMALTAMIGVAIMVESFRESLRTLADADDARRRLRQRAGPRPRASERRLDPQVVRALLGGAGRARAQRGAPRHGGLPVGSIDLNAVQSRAGELRRLQPDRRATPRRPGRSFARGALLISEPLAWRLRLAPAASSLLTTPSGSARLPGGGRLPRIRQRSRRGAASSSSSYRGCGTTRASAALGLYLAPGVQRATRGARGCVPPPAAARRC